MPANARDFFVRYAAAIQKLDFATLEPMFHPDYVGEYPQSGERFRGFAAFRAQLERYPGGLPANSAEDTQTRVVGDDERWAITPAYTVLPLAGPDRFTMINRVPYPDGSRWWIVAIITLRDDKVFHSETFFAPEFEPPEWRREMVEVVPRD